MPLLSRSVQRLCKPQLRQEVRGIAVEHGPHVLSRARVVPGVEQDPPLVGVADDRQAGAVEPG
jgi:hypothetical protein